MEGSGGAAIANLRLRGGQRLTVFSTYVRPILGRPNLTVLTRAHVRRLRFRGTRPAFAGAELRAQGWAEGDCFTLRTLDPANRVCMAADAWLS